MSIDYPILVIGADGQLGRDCMAVLQNRCPVTGLDIPAIDITDRDSVTAGFARVCPRVVINCAAWTQVDAAESAPDAAGRVNAHGAGLVAAACAKAGARMIHISTDYVFNGRRRLEDGGYLESDQVDPRSVYGRTKLAGEQAVMESGAEALIVRTAWLYGRHGMNFPKTIIHRALNRPDETLRVVADQYGSPTWSWNLAGQLAVLATADITGIAHASAEGVATWHEVARHVLETIDIPHRLEPCATADYPTPAKRPRFAVLENARLKAAGLNRMGAWRDELGNFIRQHREELIKAG